MTDRENITSNVLHQGSILADASAAVILLHGRGATAESIIRLADALDHEAGLPLAWLAPQADGNTWYPVPFNEPLERNEPHRTNALLTIDDLIGSVISAGIAPDRIALIGFSQGACLSLEYAVVGNSTPAFVGALSGGVMGPLDVARQVDGKRAGMEVFIGCGDQDGHIGLPFADRSASLLRDAGATVDYRIYPGMGHTINDDEIGALRDAIAHLAGS